MNKITVRKNLSIIKLQDKNQISQLNKLIMCNHKNYRKLILKYLNELNKVIKDKNLSVIKKNKICTKINKNKINTRKTYINFNKKLENEKNKLIKKEAKIKKLSILLKGGSGYNNNSLQRAIEESLMDLEEQAQLNAVLKLSLQEEKEKSDLNTALKLSLEKETKKTNISNSKLSVNSKNLTQKLDKTTRGPSKWSQRSKINSKALILSRLNKSNNKTDKKTTLSKLNKKFQGKNVPTSAIRSTINNLPRQTKCLNVDINKNLPNDPNFAILKTNGQNACYIDSLFMCLFHRRSSLNIIMSSLFNRVYEDIEAGNTTNENTHALQTRKILVNIFCAKINELHNNNNRHIMDLEELRVALENIKGLVANEAAQNQMVNLTNATVTFLRDQLDPSEVLDIIDAAYESKKINIFRETDIDKIDTPRGKRNSETLVKLIANLDNLTTIERRRLSDIVTYMKNNNIPPPRENKEILMHTMNIPFIDINNNNEVKYMRNYIPKSITYVKDHQPIEVDRGSGIYKHTEFITRELVKSDVILLKYKRETIVTNVDDRPVLNAVRNARKGRITHYEIRTQKVKNIFIPLETFKINNNTYECVSIIIHRGNRVRSGHYICAIKYEANSLWYMYDDTIRNLERIGTFKDLLNNEELITNGVYFLYIKQ